MNSSKVSKSSSMPHKDKDESDKLSRKSNNKKFWQFLTIL